jgi:hypothetical protein
MSAPDASDIRRRANGLDELLFSESNEKTFDPSDRNA